MDISKIDVVTMSENGFPCIIKNPKTKQDTDLVITIKGVYADRFYDESEQADDIEKTAAFLARYTVGWVNLQEKGVDVEFTLENATRIYKDYPIIRSQILSAAMDIRNFIKD